MSLPTQKIRNHNDNLGQGEFCNARWHDDEGWFCSIAAAEGHPHPCRFSESDCHLVSYTINDNQFYRIQCGGEKLGYPTLIGVCQDFEPARWLRVKFELE